MHGTAQTLQAQQAAAEAGSLFEERTLLLCWPPDESDEQAPPEVRSMAVDSVSEL